MTQRLKRSEQAGGDTEAYETPAWPVRRLLERVALPAGRWLEPCAGTGNIIRAVNAAFPSAGIEWTACEVREECTDALEAAVGVGTVDISDFLRPQKVSAYPGHRFAVDVAIGNPPFTLACEFVDACRALSPIVILLLPLPFFGTAGREAFFERNTPDAIYQLPDRPQFAYGATNSVEYGFFYWGPTRRDPRMGTTLHRLAVTPPEERGVKRRGAK